MLAPSVSDAVNLCTKAWGKRHCLPWSQVAGLHGRQPIDSPPLFTLPSTHPLPSLNEHKSLQIGLFTLLKWQSLRARFCWALQAITANRWKYSLGNNCDPIGRPQELADHWMKILWEWSRLSSNRIHLWDQMLFAFQNEGTITKPHGVMQLMLHL